MLTSVRRLFPILLAGLVVAGFAWARPPANNVTFSFPGDVDFVSGGLDPLYLTGAYLKTASVTGNTLTIELQGSDGNDGADVTFTDHHIESATLSSAQLLTVTLSDNSTVEIDLSALETSTEVTAAITSALADYLTATDIDTEIEDGALQPGDVTEGSDISITRTTDGVEISSTAADGVIESGACSGNDLVVTRSVGATVTIQEACIGSGGGAGEVNVQSDWTEADTASDAFIRNKPTVPANSDIDDRIATYARATPTGTIADAQIPSAIARDSELPDVADFLDESEVDARIATYARISPSGQIADAQIPNAIARDSEIVGFLTQSEIDGRIATYARATPTGEIADAQIPASIARDTELGIIVQDGGTEEGTGIETLNFGTNLAVAVASGVATITGQAGGGGGASLSDDEPEAVSETAAAGTGTEASRSDHRHAGIAWGVQIDTQIVPEANEDAISTPRISLRTSGLNHYLAFLDWDTADLARVDHLPVGGHIGLRQGVNTRILRVEAAWEASENRYQVANVNAAPLTEASAGTDTELLLTTSSEADGVVSASDYSITDGVLTLTRTVGAALTVNIDEIVRPVGGVLPTAADHEDRIGLSGNALFQSRYVVTVPSHSRSVTVATLPVGGVTVGGTTYGDDYAGNFAAPPNVNNYAANEYIWDRGSQVWLFNGPNPMGGRHWIGYSGPPGFRHGTFATDANAEAHANGVGEIFIVGSGSSQLVRYVSAFTAATAEQSGWVWEHVGTTFADVEATITGRLSGTAPPAIGITGNAGSSTEIARGDHHHLGQNSASVAVRSPPGCQTTITGAAVATAASEELAPTHRVTVTGTLVCELAAAKGCR